MKSGIPDVGDQDPAERNSPIAAEEDEETQFLRQDVPGDAVCWFNDCSFAWAVVFFAWCVKGLGDSGTSLATSSYR